MEGSDYFPSTSLENWKSYADHVAVVTVEAERALPARDHVLEHKEGVIGRVTTLAIERILWSAPRVPALGREIEVEQAGWIVKGDRRTPFALEGAERVVPGERYLMPLLQADTDGGRKEWWPLTQSSQLPIVDGRVAADADSGTPVRAELAGMTIEQVEEKVLAQAPDPVAEKYRHLRPQPRLEAVRKERNP